MKKNKHLRNRIIISTLIILSMAVLIIFLTPNPLNLTIKYATSEDIDVIISPETISFNDYNETIKIKVEMKNIAQENKRITKYVYEKPTENIVCTAVTNKSSYWYSSGHVDIAGPLIQFDKILEPKESFYFSFELSFNKFLYFDDSEDYLITTYLRDEDPDQFSLSISIRIKSTIGDSNSISVINQP